jgi:hypothetical protein
MVPIAPRYEPAIVALAYAFDDLNQPMAETWRRVGAAAEALGLFRPSYPHLRRFILAKRRGEDPLRRRLRTIAVAGLVGVAVASVAVAVRARSDVRRKLVAQSYKRPPP